MKPYYPWAVARARQLKVPFIPVVPESLKVLSKREERALTYSGMPFFKKAECDDPEFEYEWDRVQRLRREKHPLIYGGRSQRNRLIQGTLKRGERVPLGENPRKGQPYRRMIVL